MSVEKRHVTIYLFFGKVIYHSIFVILAVRNRYRNKKSVLLYVRKNNFRR